LLGYGPDFDYQSLRKEARARRVTVAEPERSLLLRKPSGAVPHGGGLRLPTGSPGCETVLAWLRSGAPGPAAKERRLTAITMEPAEETVGTTARPRLQVRARYDDGTTRDVTRWTRVVSN